MELKLSHVLSRQTRHQHPWPVELDLGWELDGDVHGKRGQISMVGEAQP
jgi:hypothetical protein